MTKHLPSIPKRTRGKRLFCSGVHASSDLGHAGKRRLSESLKLLATLLVVGTTFLHAAPEASAQDGADASRSAEVAKEFRKRVVKKWGWTPKYGVALTTTDYAREYLANRPDSYGDDAFRSNVTPDRLVLFQTATLDIWASEPQSVFFSVIERDSGKVLEDNSIEFQPSPGNLDAGFVDVDSSAPFELHISGTTHGGSGMGGSRFRIYDMKSGFDLMLGRTGTFNDHGCMEVQTRLGDIDDAWDLGQWDPAREDIDGELVIPRASVLVIKGRRGVACTMPNVIAHQSDRCRFDEDQREYRCKTETARAGLVLLKHLKVGGWRENARNIRWVLDNADMLKKHGFRFPDGFLERLPRHLPGHGTN